MNGTASVSGAIVMSGWSWENRNVPERLATALSHAGWRVLYCSNPFSFLRQRGETRSTLAENLESFAPKHVGHRLNSVPLVRRWQARLLAKQVLEQARQMGIERPVVFYPHGGWVVEFARELKRRNVARVYVCMDHVQKKENEALAEAAELVLAIPRTKYDQLKASFGEKVCRLPQLGPELSMAGSGAGNCEALTRLENIARPRLGYLGLPSIRVQARLLAELLTRHPDWHFVACGPTPGLRLANVHDIGWIGPEELVAVCCRIDVGFMPYDCTREFNAHCVPLKLFDYFAAGLPVVSTPIIHLREYGNLVYLGDTVEQLEDGIRQALAEAPDDPRREERRRIAREHSIDEVSKFLPNLILRALERSRAPALHQEKTLLGENEDPEARPVSRGGA